GPAKQCQKRVLIRTLGPQVGHFRSPTVQMVSSVSRADAGLGHRFAHRRKKSRRAATPGPILHPQGWMVDALPSKEAVSGSCAVLDPKAGHRRSRWSALTPSLVGLRV